MNTFDPSWLVALAAALSVSFVAWRLKALSPSGFLAATAVGGLIVIASGWWTGLLLVAFFVTGSALSRANRANEPAMQQRGSRRDAVQVLANGGVPCLMATGATLAADPGPWLVACAVAIAAATSDTWATEIGRRSQATPRRLFTWQRVPPGTSGAVSVPGTIGGLAGSILIALLGWFGAAAGWWDAAGSGPYLFAIIALIGFAGCLVDSVLGATVQAVNWCPTCDRATEQAIHRCGTDTLAAGGVRWMNNDAVNLLSVTATALAGLAVVTWWP